MNRELKFRVYIPNQERFCFFLLGDFDYANRYLDMDDYPVQQYTGLKDKNEKEIYEGDIVFKQDTEQTLLVYFEMGSFWFDFMEEKKKGWKYGLVWHDRVEVIGNIFENLEFLKNA